MSNVDASRSLLFVEVGKQQGQVFELHHSVGHIGRAPECDIVLTDSRVARRHARFRVLEDGTYEIEDLNFIIGTVVNGRRLNEHETHPLQDGDRLQIGETVLVVHLTKTDGDLPQG